MKEVDKPTRQRPYTYNDTFAKKIKEEIDKLKEIELIYEIEHTDWVSPIVVVPKKNGKLQVCVNLKKVNAATIRDNYPLLIIDHVLERVAVKEAYTFLDGFCGYNQVSIDPKDQHKTTFTTFERLMSQAFKEYLQDFLEVYMDDLCIHSKEQSQYIEHLKLIFKKCRVYQICFHPDKCIFMVRQGKILGHIVLKNGISTDFKKIKIIVELTRT